METKTEPLYDTIVENIQSFELEDGRIFNINLMKELLVNIESNTKCPLHIVTPHHLRHVDVDYAMSDSVVLGPPVYIFQEGNCMHIVDGWHRIYKAIEKGWTSYPGIVLVGECAKMCIMQPLEDGLFRTYTLQGESIVPIVIAAIRKFR